MKTALVLSAGGMFGAYQAGAWSVLANEFQPDLVVGASIGAVNGWAIAGGCTPQALIDSWLNLGDLARHRWRVPRRASHGLLDSQPVEDLIQRTHSEYSPRLPYALVATDTLRLRPVLFEGPDLTWQHVAASAAIPGLFSQHRIERRWYCDGGLLCPLPLWAAAALGADRIVAIDVLPAPPHRAVRAIALGLRRMARFTEHVPEHIEVTRITAPAGMGSIQDALCWKRANAERWIEQGMRDAAAMRTGAFAHACR